MCGIAGVLTARPFADDVLRKMAGSLTHRGPDDGGTWSDPHAGIGLAHRRLAIVDLSAAGHQPMFSADGRYLLCFNGEIYNHRRLRAELDEKGQAPEGGWRGHSDTETLVQAFAAWGVRETIVRCVGMFAMALWDRQERKLHLIRDRFGEKPLYYGWSGPALLFGSELKALRTWPGFDGEIDRRSVSELMARGFIGAPRSIYRHVYKLPPAAILTLGIEAASASPGAPVSDARLATYWSYDAAVSDGLKAPIDDEPEALAMLDRALRNSIAGQSLADVPVGAFLSGGIDSSSIVALYQTMSATPVRTFTIGFEDEDYDEAGAAKTIADALGTVHSEHRVTARDARDVIPMLPRIYDEPFADSSQIPTFLVSRFAREKVTVALTGDGGDELFAGYNRHIFAPRFWRRLKQVPGPLRHAVAAGRHLPLNRLAPLLPGNLGPQRIERLSQAFRLAGSAGSLEDVYAGLVDQWHGQPSPVFGVPAGAEAVPWRQNGPDAVRMMQADALGYLPDDILCKVDRASMAVSLETRVPFLDHRVAAIAARIPLSMKIDRGGGKAILRSLLAQYLPPNLFERPKSGFAVPVGRWLRGPLRDWAEALLDEQRLRHQGWLDADSVRRRWTDHLSGKRDSTSALWSVLMFQAWLDEAA